MVIIPVLSFCSQDQIPLIETANGVKRIIKPNGLTILLKNLPDAKVTSLRAYFRTGSVFEGEYLGSGISHLVEHMLFKGTDRYKMGESSRIVQSLGGEHNAYTSFEQVCYLITIPSAHTTQAVSILANSIFHSVFDQGELMKEKQVVLNELKMDNDDIGRAVNDLFFRETYHRLPYRYPVIGLEAVFKSLTQKDLLDYYSKKFSPANCVFVCVGNFDEAQVLQMIDAETTNLVQRPNTDPALEDEPIQKAFKYYEEFRTDAVSTRVMCGYKTVGLMDPDLYALDVLASMLGGGKTSILNKILKENKQLVQNISASSYTPSHQGVFVFEMELKEKFLSQTTNELFKIIEDVPRYLTSEDLRKVKNQVLAGTIAGMQTVDGQASDLGNNEITTGDMRFSTIYAQNIGKVTIGDIKRVWKKYFIPERMTMVAIRPTGGRTDITASFSDTSRNIPMEKRILNNGLRVVFIEKKGIPLLNLKLLTSGGLLLDSTPGIGRFVNEMIIKGSSKYPGLTAFDKIESAGGWIANYYGNNSAGVTVNVLTRDFDLGMDVLLQSVQNASFPEKSIRDLKNETIQDLRNQNEDIFTEGINLLRKTMYGDHSYSYPKLGTVAAISQLRRDQIIKYYENCYNASNSVLVVTGELTEPQKNSILQKFSTYRRGNNAVLEAKKTVPIMKTERIVKISKKNRSLVLIAYPIPALTDPSRYSIEVLNRILSGLGSRLFYQLRDVEHLGYTVGTSPALMLQDGFLLFYIGTTKEQLEQAEKGLFREIGKLNTISDNEIESAKQNILGEYRMNEQAYDSLGLSAGFFELYYSDFKLYDRYMDKIEEVSKSDLLSQVKKLFSQPYGEVIMQGDPVAK